MNFGVGFDARRPVGNLASTRRRSVASTRSRAMHSRRAAHLPWSRDVSSAWTARPAVRRGARTTARSPVGRRVHDRQPRRLDGRRRALGRPRQRRRPGGVRRAPRAPPTWWSSAPRRFAPRGTARRASIGQRIGVVTSTGDVDLSGELFASGAGFLIMPEDGPTPLTRSIDVVRAGLGRADLAGGARPPRRHHGPADVRAGRGRPAPQRRTGRRPAASTSSTSRSPRCSPADRAHASIAGAHETVAAFALAHTLVDDDGYLFTRWMRRD